MLARPVVQRDPMAEAKRVIGFVARLYVLRRDEGGRATPFRDGYRVQSRFTEDQPWDNDVTVRLEGRTEGILGHEYTARLEFLVPDAVTVAVARGAAFVLREGTRVVVRGTVQEVVFAPDGK